MTAFYWRDQKWKTQSKNRKKMVFNRCWSSSHRTITINTHLLLCSRSLPIRQYRPISAKKQFLPIHFDLTRRYSHEGEERMTITPTAIRISDRRKLLVKERTLLTSVPDNITATPCSTLVPVDGIYLGAVFDEGSSTHVISLGTLTNARFLANFRFKLWWTAQKMGDQGRQIPMETQFLLLEMKPEEGSAIEVIYTVFLPLIEGPFRACLQGNQNDELQLCLESGDLSSKASAFSHSVLVYAGTDPFATISNAIKTVKHHLKTFRQRHQKKLPKIVDYFGWCTWDAFYQDVTQEGVESGLKSLVAGGSPPKFVIIDDGWQSVIADERATQNEENNQIPMFRLTSIKENQKFQNIEDPKAGIESIVRIAKQKYGLNQVYVWHAITGYWGGVKPGVKETEPYDSSMKYPNVSKGVMENEPAWKYDPLAVQGVGLINPKKSLKFFGDMHKYLAAAGVDGVKVDVQCVLETLGEGLGGRVELTRQYHKSLDASVAANFPDNGCIACMSHNTESLYCSKQTAVIRASDDFYPRDPMSHTIHIASVAYNSIFLGEFMQPDWDMFHSLHPAAEYHASARAISGGPVYVSDAPGKHNFVILKKLVLPDGSILRALLPGRPTIDCLFTDPTRDGVSLLKIWNMNKYTGVLGVYNCQGAAWNTKEKKNTFHKTTTDALTSSISRHDIHLISETTISDPTNWSDKCAFYSHKNNKLTTLDNTASLQVSLKILEFEIFTIMPIKILSSGPSFAPLGLINMYNAGGAIHDLRYGEGMVCVEVKGSGKFGVYCSVKPRRCTVGSYEVVIAYDSLSGLVTLDLDHMPGYGRKVHTLVFEL